MRLRVQQAQWEQLGRTDPLWAILTEPERRHGGWTPEEFFLNGEQEVAAVLAQAAELGLPARRESALDFGCGAGRLTQALASRFERVVGVDIAPAMLEEAHRHNRWGERCQYVLNDQDNLRRFPDASFDLVYSSITLQHLPRRVIRRYLAEFVRLLRPGGLALFQLPSKHRYRGVLHYLLHNVYSTVARKLLRSPWALDMYGLPRATVERLIGSAGARVVRVEPESSAGEEWMSLRYFAAR